jgi:negative regulator of flagellin synthesis FlgM
MRMGSVERILAATPVVDGARVDAVRESLAEGSYVVDPVRVADRFIQFERMLGQAESRG